MHIHDTHMYTHIGKYSTRKKFMTKELSLYNTKQEF